MSAQNDNGASASGATFCDDKCGECQQRRDRHDWSAGKNRIKHPFVETEFVSDGRPFYVSAPKGEK